MRIIAPRVTSFVQGFHRQRPLHQLRSGPKKIRNPEFEAYLYWLHFGPYSWDIAQLKEGDIVRGEIIAVKPAQQLIMVNLVGVHRVLDGERYRATGVVEFRNEDPALMQMFSPTMGIPLMVSYLRTLDRDLDATLSYEDYQRRNSVFETKYDTVYSSPDLNLHLRFFHRILSAIDDILLRHPSRRLGHQTAKDADDLIHQALAEKFPDQIPQWKRQKHSPEVRFLTREIMDVAETSLNSHTISLLALGLAQRGFAREASEFVARHYNEFGTALIKNLIRISVENNLLLTGPFYRLLEPRFRKDFLREVVKFFGDTRQFPHLRYAHLHADLKF